MSNIRALVGKTLAKIEGAHEGGTFIVFTCSDGEQFVMFHAQDCCEDVRIDDINGDINDLIGLPITMAEESTNHEEFYDYDVDSCTWTFYKLATPKGYVNIKWYGESNGYYSESVDFYPVDCVKFLYNEPEALNWKKARDFDRKMEECN